MMKKIYFIVFFLFCAIFSDTEVYAQKYFKSRVYQDWLDSLAAVAEKGAKEVAEKASGEQIVYIKIGSKKYRYLTKFDSSLIGQKASYKAGYYTFDGKKAAFDLKTFKKYADAIGCQKSYKGVGFIRTLPYILGAVGAGAGAGIAYSLTPEYCTPTSYAIGSGIAGLGLGFLIGKALVNSKYEKIPKDYNACIKEKAKKKKKLKAMIPNDINLGMLPTGNGNQTTTLGFSWKF
jgi:hypothetical protein